MINNIAFGENTNTYWTVENKKPVLCEYGVLRKLPRINVKFKPLLDMLKVTYAEVIEEINWFGEENNIPRLEIWDVSCLEEEEITAPVLVKQGFEMVCVNERFTAKTYTKETMEKAIAIYEMVRPKIIDYERFLALEKRIEGKEGVIIRGPQDFANGTFELYGKKFGAYQVLYQDAKTGNLEISTKPYMTVIVDLDKIDKNGNIKITVDRDIPIGKLIGSGGWQARRIAKTFGVRNVMFSCQK